MRGDRPWSVVRSGVLPGVRPLKLADSKTFTTGVLSLTYERA
ncbi:hypothetical protein AB0M95_24965 [Sphaerisporangium sp. NPDC051017]